MKALEYTKEKQKISTKKRRRKVIWMRMGDLFIMKVFALDTEASTKTDLLSPALTQGAVE